MQRINDIYFENIYLLYEDENYSIISISDTSIIEEVFKVFGINPLIASKHDIQLQFVIDDIFLKLEKIILSKNVPNTNEYLGAKGIKIGGKVIYEVNYNLNNLKVVFCKEKRKSKFKWYPFHFPYEYQVVKFFDSHYVYDLSNSINELINLNLRKLFKTRSISSVEEEFMGVVKKIPNNINFEDILSFEDYYEYMKERKE